MAIPKIKLAEVVSHDSAYQYDEVNLNRQFSITVRTFDYDFVQTLSNVRPANINELNIPLKGEHVWIYSAIDEETTPDKSRMIWYYTKPINIQSNINNNLLPGVNKNADGIELTDNESFEDNETSPLQPYQGDILYQGRYGNSIRLSSTVKGGSYSEDPSWSGASNGDPIIIISNGRKIRQNKRYTIENIYDDHSSLYLSSTQRIQNLNLNLSVGSDTVRKYKSLSAYNRSQYIGYADRIVLSAKKDIALIAAQKAIVLHSKNILLGNDQAAEPLPNGNVLLSVLKDILNALNSGATGPAGMQSLITDQASLISATTKLNNLLNDKYKIAK